MSVDLSTDRGLKYTSQITHMAQVGLDVTKVLVWYFDKKNIHQKRR